MFLRRQDTQVAVCGKDPRPREAIGGKNPCTARLRLFVTPTARSILARHLLEQEASGDRRYPRSWSRSSRRGRRSVAISLGTDQSWRASARWKRGSPDSSPAICRLRNSSSRRATHAFDRMQREFVCSRAKKRLRFRDDGDPICHRLVRVAPAPTRQLATKWFGANVTVSGVDVELRRASTWALNWPLLLILRTVRIG